MNVAIVHDYLTQRGGAERVVLAMCRAFPHAPVHTSLYEPAGTFPEFADRTVLPSVLNRFGPLRRHHRWGLPAFAPVFGRMVVDADVAICSSSGWAHGARVTGRKVVYCHTPARWLYQTSTYLGGRRWTPLLQPLRQPLMAWDRRAAAGADRYLANSRVVQTRIRELYGVEADLLPPPPAIIPDGPQQEVGGLDDPFFLCVSRLLPYKNVDAVVEAFRSLGTQLVIVGTGPAERALRAVAPAHVRFLGPVADAELRWLYGRAEGLVAASYEDYGLTPLEAAAMGTPAVVLRWGGFLDTVVEGETGTYFDEPEPALIAEAVRRLQSERPSRAALLDHAERFSEATFVQRIGDVAAAVATS
jgi:glycosyltransferase involved in cell wall biosynthesis